MQSHNVRGRQRGWRLTFVYVLFAIGLMVVLYQLNATRHTMLKLGVATSGRPNTLITAFGTKLNSIVAEEATALQQLYHDESDSLRSAYQYLQQHNFTRNATQIRLAGRPRRQGVRHFLVILVPYRDREEQLRVFAAHVTAHLAREGILGRIYVVEQQDGPFNRGFLLNLGFLAAETEASWVAVHDVDLLPDPGVSYALPSGLSMLHLARRVSAYDNLLPYPRFLGGALLLTPGLFRGVNGYSNGYWGWGGEDDDLGLRLARNLTGGWAEDNRFGEGCPLPCVAPESGRFIALPDPPNFMREDDFKADNAARLASWAAAEGSGPAVEGLSTLEAAGEWASLVAFRDERPDYTLLQVSLPPAVQPGKVPVPQRLHPPPLQQPVADSSSGPEAGNAGVGAAHAGAEVRI